MHARISPIVFAASCDQDWRAGVRAKLQTWSTLVFVESLHQLPRAAMFVPDIVLWHLDESIELTDRCTAAFEYIRRVAPHSAVIACGEPGRATGSHLLLAGRAGVDRLVLRGFDDLACSVRELWRAAPVETYVHGVLARLDLSPGRAATAVEHCLRRTAIGPLTVQRLAEELEVTRRTLSAWCRVADLPAPERLIGWSRVCAIARLLADPELSIGQIARALAFSSESDLRRMVSRYVGCTPTRLRASGGVPAVIDALTSHRSTGRIPIGDG